MRLLFSLCNHPERLVRLLHQCLDKGMAVRCSGKSKAILNQGSGTFWVDFDDAVEIPTADDPPCRSMQFLLINKNPDLNLVAAILSAEGLICETIEEADLIICENASLHDAKRSYPRKLVITETELQSCLARETEQKLLAPIIDPGQHPPSLPSNLKACWTKLRKRSIQSIDEGLELFSSLVSVDPVAGDPLLDQVSVVNGVLVPGSRFQLTDRNTHPFSNYCLLAILSRSPSGSRGDILKINLKQLVAQDDPNFKAIMTVAALPELNGFKNLEGINLYLPNPEPLSPEQSRRPKRWGELSCLTSLEITTEVSINLDHLDAPALKRVKLEGKVFDSVGVLRRCSSLEHIDISNTSVSCLEPLSELGETCMHLNLGSTPVTSLQSISAFKALEFLDLSYCKGITSLKGLGRSVNLKVLELSGLPALQDISDLHILSELEELTINRCPEIVDFTVLGHLPCLKMAKIFTDQRKAIALPKIWPESLHCLKLSVCTERIGVLPSGYDSELDLRSISRLSSLEDLVSCKNIAVALFTQSVLRRFTDITPLASCEHLWLHVDMQLETRMTEDIIKLLSALPICRLRLDGYNEKFSFVEIASLANLVALDLVGFSRLTKQQLQPLIGTSALRYFGFPAGKVPGLGGCTFNTPTKIDTLKMMLMAL